MSKSKEALALLDDLDNFTAPPTSQPKAGGKAKVKAKTSSVSSSSGVQPPAVNDKDAADALAFLDEITQKSAEPRKTLQALPTTTTRVTLGGSRPGTPSQAGSSIRKSAEAPRTSPKAPDAASAAPAGSWGWGSVWNTASAALAQAREKVEEQAKNLPAIPQIPQTEQARKWGEGVVSYAKQAQLDKLGMSTSASVQSQRLKALRFPSSGLQDNRTVHSDGHHERCCASDRRA